LSLLLSHLEVRIRFLGRHAIREPSAVTRHDVVPMAFQAVTSSMFTGVLPAAGDERKGEKQPDAYERMEVLTKTVTDAGA